MKWLGNRLKRHLINSEAARGWAARGRTCLLASIVLSLPGMRELWSVKELLIFLQKHPFFS